MRATWVAVGLVVWSARIAAAIPVFARIYGKPCGTCHTVYPQLNPDGERFRAHGLHGLTPVVEPIHVADGVDLPGTLPVAISLAAGEDLTHVDVPGQPDPVNTHFDLDFLALLAGGEIGPHVSFLADYAPLYTNPFNGEIHDNDRPGLGMLQFHGEHDGWLANLKLGYMELPFGPSPRVHRLSVQSYLAYDLNAFTLLGRPPPVTGARTDSLVLSSTQVAAEVDLHHEPTATSLFVGVTNGSNNREDNNGSKDVYARVQQRLGPAALGLFAYYSPDVLGRGARDQALRVGPDLDVYTRRLRVLATALAAWDANPTGVHEALWYWTGFVEGDWRWTPKLLSLARFDAAFSRTFDDRARGGTTVVHPWLWSTTGGLQYLLEDNLKLVAEATYGQSERVPGFPAVTVWTCTFRIATAFWPLDPPIVGRWLARGLGT